MLQMQFKQQRMQWLWTCVKKRETMYTVRSLSCLTMTQIASFFSFVLFRTCGYKCWVLLPRAGQAVFKNMSHSALMPILKPQRLDSLCIANCQYFPPFHVLVSYAVLKIVSNALLTESAFRWNGFRKHKTA